MAFIKIQARITERQRQQLDEFKADNNCSNDGEALRDILAVFFDGASEQDTEDTEQDTKSDLEERIAKLEKLIYLQENSLYQQTTQAKHDRNEIHWKLDGLEQEVSQLQEDQHRIKSQVSDLLHFHAEDTKDTEQDTETEPTPLPVEPGTHQPKPPVTAGDTAGDTEQDTDSTDPSLSSSNLASPESYQNKYKSQPEEDLGDLEVSREDKDNLKSLSATQLGKRLKVSAATIGNKRKSEKINFEQWSQERDPENLVWHYDPKAKRYLAKYLNPTAN